MKLLAIDMDGTCLDSKNKISEKNLYALKNAKEHGYEIVPATGRALSCMPHQLLNSGLYRYVITSNGARVFDTTADKTIFRELIPLDEVLLFLDRCQKQKFGVTVHICNEFVVQGKPLATLGRFLYGTGARNIIVVKNLSEFLTKLNEDVEELQLFLFAPGTREKAALILESHNHLLSAFGDKYAEIYSFRANKGNALEALAEKLCISKEDIICIGDAANDIPMFEKAGIKFAVGNAIKELKERADHILPSNNNDAVAEAILKHLV